MLVLLSLLTAAVASMPIYAVTSSGRDDPLDMEDRGSFVLGGFVRSWFYWFLQPVERLSLALRISPTAFNLMGVFFGVAAGYLFATGRVNLGGWAVLMGGAADVLDGRIARAQGLEGPRGAFLDSTLDRFAEVGAFAGLAVYFQDSVLATVIVVMALSGSLLVSYTRARGESQGIICKVGIMQRAERLLLVGFGGVLDAAIAAWTGLQGGTPLLILLLFVSVGTLGTAAYRTVWIASRLD